MTLARKFCLGGGEVGAMGRVATVFAKSAEGAVHFNVSVRIDMDEFASWQPERITAFFNGIAEVLTAKAYSPNIGDNTGR